MGLKRIQATAPGHCRQSKRWRVPYAGLKAPEPPAFDFRRLLKAYMLTILREEGVTHVRNSGIHLAGDLTAHERAAILEISNEVKKENPDDAA